MTASALSVIIPTYRREQVLLDTIKHLQNLKYPPAEILVVDQTGEHEPSIHQALDDLNKRGDIRWIHLPYPSITHAMNTGLLEARSDIVLFLDDDIIPHKNLIYAHLHAHQKNGCNIIAGQVIQPWDDPDSEKQEMHFQFYSTKRQYVSELMGGNFSIKRSVALSLGGFDENFVHVAYRFEAEFADRALAAGEKLLFEPEASIRHLKATKGGTRSYGEHLHTIKPSHAVGAYYYLMTSKLARNRTLKILGRSLCAIRTKYHLHHPWLIPVTLIAEFSGFIWAVILFLRGQRLLNINGRQSQRHD